MFKKIVEFFTGKKPEVVATPNVSAPYKLEPPAATTPLPYVPLTTPPLVVETAPAPKAAVEKKKRTFVKKPAVIPAPAEKKPAKPRAKKTSQ